MPSLSALLDPLRNRISPGTKRRVAEWRLRARKPTARWRVLPDFLVIGTMRGGTSSLYRYLAGHPQVSASIRKEVAYFTYGSSAGEDWYRAHFPLRMARRRTFEASPGYLVWPTAPARVHALLPDARFVACLREPLDRAWSHHQQMTRLGFEDLDFAEALEAEPARLAGEVERLTADPDYRPLDYIRYSYALRGRYAEQLDRWKAHVPADRLLLVRSEDLFADPRTVLARIVEFVGLDPWEPGELRNWSYHSTGETPPSPIDPETRRRLAPLFEDANRRLAVDHGFAPWTEHA